MCAFLLAAVSCLAATPKLTFIKEFPGSSPAYVYLSINRLGAVEYKESPSDENPLSTSMKQAQSDGLFDLADKLDYFKQPLESGLKVANTGKKTFRYEDSNGVVSESVFNYSVKPQAQQLLDRLEQIAATERAYIDLDRTIHFDKLGVNDSLAEIEALWVRKQLAAPEQFISLFNYITRHESFMHLVRDRAARLKDEFQAPVTVAPAADNHQ